METTTLNQFILQLSAEAGEYLRNNFYTFKNVFHRDVGSLATNVDLELEATLRRRISEAYPDHAITVVGGEAGDAAAEYHWIIDPLDGSQHFSRNIPIYTVNIAVQKHGETIFGAVNHPQTNQLFFAELGKGAWLNGIDIHISEQTELAKAFVFVELPERKFSQQPEKADFDQRMAAVAKLVERAGQVETFRIGGFGQCLVAAGAFDAYVDLSGTSRADSQAASQLILREAGGEIIDLSPKRDGFIQVLATNGTLTNDLQHVIGNPSL